MTADDPFIDAFGPIDFLAVEFPGGKVVADGFQMILDLVDRGVIRVLDLEFLARREDGSIERIEAHDLGDAGGLDMALFDGASSGLLMPEDFEVAAEGMREGSVAAVLVYEELSMLPVIAAWEAGGATRIGEGAILVEEIEAALDATES